jgi:equilibrative nucleoside transporter 1/2/3
VITRIQSNSPPLHSEMTENKPKLSLKAEAPTSDSIKDAFWVVYMLFFLLGLVHMLPWSFFITAYDVRMVFVRAGTNLAFQYWMHKFRDTSYDEVDSSHRTSLQTQFSPSLTISIHVSTVLSQLWALLYGRRYSVNMKLSVPLSILLLFFVIEAIFIVVDTDSWQTGFFTLTMIVVVVINGTPPPSFRPGLI